MRTVIKVMSFRLSLLPVTSETTEVTTVGTVGTVATVGTVFTTRRGFVNRL